MKLQRLCSSLFLCIDCAVSVFFVPYRRYLAANGAIMRTSILGVLNFNGKSAS